MTFLPRRIILIVSKSNSYKDVIYNKGPWGEYKRQGGNHMRIVEKVLYGLGGLVALMLFFIALCHYNPDLAKKIGGVLQANASENPNISLSVAGTTAADSVIDKTFTVGEFPAAVHTDLTQESVTTNEQTQAYATDEPEVELTIPSNVAGLSGYIPIKATGTEITDTKADEIASTLSKGKTGENLTFDTQMYPYYGIIDETQKALYRQIYANANAQIKNFLPVENVTANDLKNAFTSVVNDHPELFWVDTAYRYKYTPKGKVADITLVFNITANDLEASKTAFESATKQIIDETYGYYTDYEKERIAHDALIAKVKYDANAPMNQSAYSALVYGRTVCAGYARAFQYVLHQLDIPCYYVTGYAGQNHAWNIVKLDSYYNVDSTWDDTNPNTYDYFNCSDEDYASDHVRTDLSIYLPACNGNRYSGLEVKPSDKPPVNNNTDTNPPGTTPTPSVPPTTTTPPSTTPPSGSTTTPPTTQTDGITVVTVRGGGDAEYIDNIEDYYVTCFASMIDKDSSTIHFDLIVTDKKLWDQIYKSYAKGECQEGYIDRYLVEKHKNACSMRVEAVPRTDGSYLLRHSAIIN